MAMIQATGRSNLGVTLDFGHSAYGGQNPAEELSLLEASGVPYYIHINDNDGRWDIIGTFEANSRITARIERVLDSVGDGKIEKMIAGQDYLATWKFIEERIFRLGEF